MNKLSIVKESVEKKEKEEGEEKGRRCRIGR